MPEQRRFESIEVWTERGKIVTVTDPSLPLSEAVGEMWWALSPQERFDLVTAWRHLISQHYDFDAGVFVHGLVTLRWKYPDA